MLTESQQEEMELKIDHDLRLLNTLFSGPETWWSHSTLMQMEFALPIETLVRLEFIRPEEAFRRGIGYVAGNKFRA